MDCNDHNDTPVTIGRCEYDELKEAQATLAALRTAGVDSWSGYDLVMEAMEAA